MLAFTSLAIGALLLTPSLAAPFKIPTGKRLSVSPLSRIHGMRVRMPSARPGLRLSRLMGRSEDFDTAEHVSRDISGLDEELDAWRFMRYYQGPPRIRRRDLDGDIDVEGRKLGQNDEFEARRFVGGRFNGPSRWRGPFYRRSLGGVEEIEGRGLEEEVDIETREASIADLD